MNKTDFIKRAQDIRLFFEGQRDFDGTILDPKSLYDNMIDTIRYFLLHPRKDVEGIRYCDKVQKALSLLRTCLLNIGYVKEEYGDDWGQVLFKYRDTSVFSDNEAAIIIDCMNGVIEALSE